MGRTRHSVGMAAVNHLARKLKVAECWKVDRQCSGDVALAEVGELQLVLLKPRMLMNINGGSVAKTAEKFQVNPEDIFLVHDELDKPLGKFSIKQGGSARGHNGVRSCIDCLKSDVMPRLRIGIGRPPDKSSVQRHVLGKFSSLEEEALKTILEQSTELLLKFITEKAAGKDSRETPAKTVTKRSNSFPQS
ncbi:probable peptidyl-tRNA hydrolase isoform X2 [Latimeria chalumnae]|nr:PREDICTED: probable peptidyl-tRNA hydrolase isoform X2 [Latimeria chalumnae]|eukprot:XP_014341670.1 PREDICTED: probable peptidyl-tRNA hydrolase isoform X2 [Latimeria chalumnae]